MIHFVKNNTIFMATLFIPLGMLGIFRLNERINEQLCYLSAKTKNIK